MPLNKETNQYSSESRTEVSPRIQPVPFPGHLLLLLLLLLLLYSLESSSDQGKLMDLQWNLSDSTSPQVSRNLLSIQADQQRCSLDGLHSSSYFQILQSLIMMLLLESFSL